jgi:hypothetical protein
MWLPLGRTRPELLRADEPRTRPRSPNSSPSAPRPDLGSTVTRLGPGIRVRASAERSNCRTGGCGVGLHSRPRAARGSVAVFRVRHPPPDATLGRMPDVTGLLDAAVADDRRAAGTPELGVALPEVADGRSTHPQRAHELGRDRGVQPGRGPDRIRQSGRHDPRVGLPAGPVGRGAPTCSARRMFASAEMPPRARVSQPAAPLARAAPVIRCERCDVVRQETLPAFLSSSSVTA